jgi:hypothetical protein
MRFASREILLKALIFRPERESYRNIGETVMNYPLGNVGDIRFTVEDLGL